MGSSHSVMYCAGPARPVAACWAAPRAWGAAHPCVPGAVGTPSNLYKAGSRAAYRPTARDIASAIRIGRISCGNLTPRRANVRSQGHAQDIFYARNVCACQLGSGFASDDASVTHSSSKMKRPRAPHRSRGWKNGGVARSLALTPSSFVSLPLSRPCRAREILFLAGHVAELLRFRQSCLLGGNVGPLVGPFTVKRATSPTRARYPA